MKLRQQLYAALSLLALSQIVKADYLGKTSLKNHNVCKSQFNGTILPHTTDCQKFLVCINEKPQEYNCDPNFHFDKNKSSCEAGTECTTANTLKPSCVDGTVKAVRDDCYIFNICVKGQYQKINCAANYYYHAPHGVCVPLKFNAQFKCSCVLPEHTVLANENNCETYFVCQGKTSVLQKCPLGQYYNSTINSCLPDLQGICLTKTTKNPTTKKDYITDAKILCARLGLNNVHYQTFPLGCNQFYICVNGILHTEHCPLGFYYDSNKKYCVVDMENKCTDYKAQEFKQIKQEEANIVNKMFLRIPEDSSETFIETVAKTPRFLNLRELS